MFDVGGGKTSFKKCEAAPFALFVSACSHQKTNFNLSLFAVALCDFNVSVLVAGSEKLYLLSKMQMRR